MRRFSGDRSGIADRACHSSSANDSRVRGAFFAFFFVFFLPSLLPCSPGSPTAFLFPDAEGFIPALEENERLSFDRALTGASLRVLWDSAGTTPEGSGRGGSPFAFRLSFSASLWLRCFPSFKTTTCGRSSPSSSSALPAWSLGRSGIAGLFGMGGLPDPSYSNSSSSSSSSSGTPATRFENFRRNAGVF